MITFLTVKLKKKKLTKMIIFVTLKLKKKNNKHDNIFYCKAEKKSTNMIHFENCKTLKKQKI